MSWVDKISDGNFVIKCGEGTSFSPMWMNASRAFEYNISEFEFRNVSGTLVKRGQPKGMKYSLEIIFQGDDHLDVAESFRIASNDPRPWTMFHPLYGSIVVHPTGLAFDDSKLNTTTITGSVIETILEDNPKVSTDPKDKITEECGLTNENLNLAYSANVVPNTKDKVSLAATNQSAYDKAKKWAGAESENYLSAFNKANTAILNATSDPLAAIRAAQEVINAPALFATSIGSRIDTMEEQFTELNDSVSGITRKSAKIQYENQAGSIISAMAMASINPQDGDYTNTNSVLVIAEKIIDIYNNYVFSLDFLQSGNGGSPDSYIPDPSALISLSALVNYTFANLFKIALSAKQERKIILESDSNAIILAHRFYGLSPDDSTIETLMMNNNIGLSEIHVIKKGREIIYYV